MNGIVMHDVIVVGAGPAGATVARVLAEQGYDVLVLEEHLSVGEPAHCTGVLGLDAFREFDLPRESILGVARSARFRGTSGSPVVIETDDVTAAIVDRVTFDRVLAERAIAAGATVLAGTRVTGVDVTASDVRVRAIGSGSTFSARVCVLACGANYKFNRYHGLGVPRAFMQSAQVHVPFPAIEHVDVRFGREVAPGGFAWVVPFRSDDVQRARIGLICETNARARFQALARSLANEFGVDADRFPSPRMKLLPLAPVRKTHAERLVAVGDAAGLVKPTTGGGIYYSMLSGCLAGEVLGEALRRDALDERSLRVYETGWRARLGPEIRVGLAFRAIAARLGDRAIDALVELARVDGLVPLLKETADFNWHRNAALALLRNASFRRVVLSSLWA